ncbi:hypothetical protein Corgl_0244 [Coriobacterium glomerans PW2]|uniref:Uncharacterized protein n=2 Tax=Coriobacterium TaxID=33870 RepID=F2N731_CORGP|nr:hypothetical protein Corgl_0244 [Coriobacterium glomerans PW2]
MHMTRKPTYPSGGPNRTDATAMQANIARIVLYVIAALLAFYTLWAALECYEQINQLVAQGQLSVSGNEFNIVTTYMSHCAGYGVDAIIVFSLGWLIFHSVHKTSSPANPERASQTVISAAPDSSDREEQVVEAGFAACQEDEETPSSSEAAPADDPVSCDASTGAEADSVSDQDVVAGREADEAASSDEPSPVAKI